MQQDTRDVELIDYLETLVRRKWLIALVVLASVAGAWLHTSRKPVYYSAGSLIYVAAQSAELQTTELNLQGLTPQFYVKVATADEVRLKMKALQAQVLDSLGKAGAPMSMEALIVEETGIELRVRSPVRELPVDLVNAWTDTFLILSQGLSADQLGSIYESVQVQFDTASVRLERAENELEMLGSGSRIEALRNKSERTVSAMDALQVELATKEFELAGMRGDLEASRAFVNSLEHEGRPIYLVPDSVLAKLDISGLHPVARQLLGFMRQRAEMQERISQISLSSIEQLSADQNASARLRGRRLRKTIDSYRNIVDEASVDVLVATDLLWGARQALETLAPTVISTKAIADEELWRHADGGELTSRQVERLDRLKLVSETANPSYLAMAAEEARFIASAEVARHRLLEGTRALLALQDTLAELSPSLRGIEMEQQRVEFRSESMRSELALFTRLIGDLQQKYRSARLDAGLLISEIALLTGEVEDLRRRGTSLQVNSMATLDSLSLLSLSGDRLIRSTETLRKTYDRFAQLSEEARIAVQIASTNLRVITRAVTPVGEGFDVTKAMSLAGLVGLLVSVFLAFLYEYWRRTHGRTTGT